MKTIKLTYELIHSVGSYGGHGFNRKQLDLLNVNWPPRQGWVKWLIGQEIPESTWEKVVALKGQAKWKLKQQQTNNERNKRQCVLQRS